MNAITCMSVLEHGVNTNAFLESSWAALSPEGRLIVSVDYWPTPTPRTTNLFGRGDIVFDAEALDTFLSSAKRIGFAAPVLTSELTATSHAEALSSELPYTFAYASFVKPS
jgi:2-polyprenyl-3-methyl-5-hydroxy-6-metoxy-1,4-benzoquinol methylase